MLPVPDVQNRRSQWTQMAQMPPRLKCLCC